MKPGQTVTYVDAGGHAHKAKVGAISGTGRSGYKILDLTVGEESFEGVKHAGDVEAGEAHWSLESVRTAEKTAEKVEEHAEEPKAAKRRKR